MVEALWFYPGIPKWNSFRGLRICFSTYKNKFRYLTKELRGVFRLLLLSVAIYLALLATNRVPSFCAYFTESCTVFRLWSALRVGSSLRRSRPIQTLNCPRLYPQLSSQRMWMTQARFLAFSPRMCSRMITMIRIPLVTMPMMIQEFDWFGLKWILYNHKLVFWHINAFSHVCE